MTTLRDKIEVMEACLRGESIEYKNKSSNLWRRAENPGFDWLCCEYRVKRKPRVFYANQYNSGCLGHAREFRVDCKEHGGRNVEKVVKFVEVLED